MKRWLVIACLLAGCSATEQSTMPPTAAIHANEATYDTVLGTYCWANTCVDEAGPAALLEHTAPIDVTARDEISISIDGEQPSERELILFSDEQQHVALDNNTFIAPDEAGLYVYTYGVWWQDGDALSGDAFYAFSLNVTENK